MLEPREPRSIIDAAEQAAAAGNYASAEALLRKAARLQEARLGPLHPDLANTLNNLGVVCEITDKPADAEQFFRRAVSIATTVLKADHPFVATSRKNLRDFCDAHRKSVELLLLPAVTTKVEAGAESPNQQLLVQRKIFGLVAFGALGPIAMLMVILAAVLPRFNSTGQAESLSPVAIDSARDIPAPSHAPLPVEPIPEPKETTTTGSGPDEATASPIAAASSPALPTVIRAQLCGSLDEWLCDPADQPVPRGPVFFYTKVKSASATTIQHRWYQGERLKHSVELRVEANPSDGYRAFSRYTMTDESAGNWKVELRTGDGALLQEERFSVR